MYFFMSELVFTKLHKMLRYSSFSTTPNFIGFAFNILLTCIFKKHRVPLLLNKGKLYMLGALITSKTRLKLLIKFFVSAGNTGYLRGIAEEFDESTNAIRKELNQLTEAGFLERKQEQKKVLYQANIAHPLFNPVQRLVHSFLGVDKVVDQVMERAGDVQEVMLVGAYA